MVNANTRAEAGCSWHSIIRDPKDNGVGPSEPMTENFRRTPYASLVREAIQNSLDVAITMSGKPVIISFNIGSLTPANFPNFFEIRKHIQGCIDNFPNDKKAHKIYPPMLEYLNQATRPGGALHYIRVSDHNTVGMHYDNPENNDAPFYAFVRSAGVSSKSDESAGGSFGFGKAAYFYLSAIRTIMVSTKTDKGKYYFEGVASLCSHKIDGQTLSNLIYYDNNGGEPVVEYDKIPGRFQRKDDTGAEHGSGSDIYIMGVDIPSNEERKNIYRQMFMAVLENFWLSILHNKLVVKIGDKNNEEVIDSSNIAQLMAENFEENDSNTRKNYNPRPYFDAVNLADSSDKFYHCEINLNKFEELTVISSHDWGHVHYFFYKNKNAQNRIVYMRSLRMKVSITPGRNGEGYYGVIFCPDGLCNEYLRETEDPAHAKWDPNRIESKHEKRIAQTLLRIIESEKDRIIREIFDLDSVETVKIKGLEQYLYITSEADDDDDADGKSSITGEPTDTFIDEGFSPTTDTTDIRSVSPASSSTLLGRVYIQQPGATTPNDKGTILTGRGDTRVKKPHTTNHVSTAKPRQRNSQTEGDETSHTIEPIMVKYRTFAQKNGSDIVHRIVITSDHEVGNGRIDLLVGGESSDSKISIAESSHGLIFENSIVGLNLSKGSNKLTIRFADNLQHSIKLAAYEIK